MKSSTFELGLSRPYIRRKKHSSDFLSTLLPQSLLFFLYCFLASLLPCFLASLLPCFLPCLLPSLLASFLPFPSFFPVLPFISSLLGSFPSFLSLLLSLLPSLLSSCLPSSFLLRFFLFLLSYSSFLFLTFSAFSYLLFLFLLFLFFLPSFFSLLLLYRI